MRETIKRLLPILGIFALATLFLSCPDEPQIQEQEDKAIVSFSVMDGVARTVLPYVSLADVASYKLLGEINGAAVKELKEFTTRGATILLESGMWNFTLNAYNKDGKHILQGKVVNKQISVTGNNQVNFSLSGVNSGTGTIAITLNFPVSAGITRINANGDVGSQDFTITNSGSFVYTKNEIAVGDYLINFELYRGEVFRTVVSELVVVRSNLSSSKTITLAGDNLKPLPAAEIIIDLAGMNEWELTKQTVQATADVDKIFTVAETYTTYRWYLDGTQVGTLSSYTFNQSGGVYQLAVVVTNSSGERRSGRCRISIASPLSANVWSDGSITDVNNEDWYSFPVSSGTTYYIWWNDRKQGNWVRTGDVAVSVQYENADTFIFGGTDTTVDSGWTTAQYFTADQDGMVYIRVILYNRSSSNTGTYGIVYSTSSTRPTIYTVAFSANGGSGAVPAAQAVNPGSGITLPNGSGLSRDGYIFVGWNTNSSGTGTDYNVGASYTPTGDVILYARWYITDSVWVNGTLNSATSEDWYSFPVTSGTTYRIWWNDRNDGNSTKTGIVAVSVRYAGSSSWIFGGTNTTDINGYTYSMGRSFTANQTGTVEIRVIPYDRSSTYTGTFGIVYSTGTTRPAL
jgi:uncharacterized repeat protein (TIGR02543 family)